ncbi:MAG: hypothetical protein QM753_05550 [Thermomicrobiales bacterium]
MAGARQDVIPIRDRADIVLVVLTIEDRGIKRRRSAREEVVAAVREMVLAEVTRHLLAGAEGAEIPEAHLRIRAVIFHVHRVVLASLHHAILVGVPAAGEPGELQRAADRRPAVA